MKIDVEIKYTALGGERIDHLLYESYLKSMENVFDFKAIDSFCDVSFSDGGLASLINNKSLHIDIENLNYFNYIKQKSSSAICNSLELNELSDSFLPNREFDIVSFFDLEGDFRNININQFIDNLVKISKDILILGWSKNQLETCDIHSKPDCDKKIIKQMHLNGFDLWLSATKQLRNCILKENVNTDNKCLYDTLTIFKKKKYLPLHYKRFIQGCSTDNMTQGMNATYRGAPLQVQLLKLRDKIYIAVAEKKPLSILRFHDGEVYFANALPVGSAQPGVRALSVNYCEKSNIHISRRAIFKADIVATILGSVSRGALFFSMLLEVFYKFFPNYHYSFLSKNWKFNRWYYHFIRLGSKLLSYVHVRIVLWPILSYLRYRLKVNKHILPIIKPFECDLETVYGLVASRLIFRMFPNQIMLVGQEEKLNAVKILSEFQEYRNYLGIECFNSFVGVKAIGAADNEELILKSIKSECEKSNPKIILLGIGCAKLFTLPLIKEFSNAVVIDIGAGIDALAGVISQDRPFFADWINYKSRLINYSDMKMVDVGNPNRDNIKYKKINLD
ncbi:MAG: hypothetical protein COA79_11355 [Planctomycetota bacterium]|nr:MAG: hypothetical protein COA79_11355 [Planctomycetota bacterium]